MSEPDATNLPGIYNYAIPGAQLDHDAGQAGYLMRINETTTPITEGIFVTVNRRSAWDDPRASHVTAGTFGEGVLLAADAVTAAALAASGSGEIADAVWDEARAGHVAAGSFGEGVLLTTAGEDALVDKIWDEPTAGHTTAGTTGKALTDGVAPTLGDIADAVWDEPIGGHTTVGTTGARLDAISAANIASAVWDEDNTLHLAANSTGLNLSNAGGGATPAAIADAVWDETVSGHVTTGTFGELTQIIGGLTQLNHRMQNAVYDVDGRIATAELHVYPTSADATADTNVLAIIDVTFAYDVDGNLSGILGAKQ
jgi:hypothetical protein